MQSEITTADTKSGRPPCPPFVSSPGYAPFALEPSQSRDAAGCLSGSSKQHDGGANTKTVLDACCGSRMFWFDRADDRAIFVDKRRETHELTDKSSKGGSRSLVIDPDLQADFTALPFAGESFALVVFDPPHLIRNGVKGWLAKKYGKLEGDWRDELRRGFAECFRVLKPEGTLIFKWNEHEVPVSQVLALTSERPLIGNRCGKTAKSHWLVFLKAGVRTDEKGTR